MEPLEKEILLIDKPEGMTSFDVIRFLRKKYGIRKMGHAGTLDPAATGLLIIGMGKGTKKLRNFLKMSKVYEARILLGKKTSTGDTEGKIIEERDVDNINEKQIKKAAASLKGKSLLRVPVYSAVKVSGMPLYKIARKYGYKNIKSPRKKMEVIWVRYHGACRQDKGYLVHLTIKVGSGTYIRSLAEELGRKLNVPAVLQHLRRLKIGAFDVKNAEKIATAV